MNTKTKILLDLWAEARTRFTNQLQNIQEDDLKKKMPPSQNSLGFLIRHIGDVELLFSKNVFGNNELKISAKTVIAQHDTNEWTDLESLKEYVLYSASTLKAIVEKQTDEDWETRITTKEFGEKSKAEAFGRIISHTAYHAGQMAMIKKYGS